MSRFIYLREHSPDCDFASTPPDEYCAERPRFEQKPYRIQTDSAGLIKSGNELPDPKLKIVAIGDSVCECLYVEENYRIWSVLSRLLSSGGIAIDILNAGVSNNHLLHIANKLLNKIIPLDADALIIFGGICDRLPAAARDSYWSKDPLISTIVDKRHNGGAEQLLKEVNFVDMRRMVGLIRQIANAFEIPIVFVTVPHLNSEGDEYYTLMRKSNDVIRDCCATEKIPIIDLEASMLIKEDAVYDYVHFNAKGCDDLAQKIATSPAMLRILSLIRNHQVKI